jgi:hypothetical protein
VLPLLSALCYAGLCVPLRALRIRLVDSSYASNDIYRWPGPGLLLILSFLGCVATPHLCLGLHSHQQLKILLQAIY